MHIDGVVRRHAEEKVMRQAFMSIQKGHSTYSEGMTLVAADTEPGNPGARRRR
jgi:hypothetical protein